MSKISANNLAAIKLASVGLAFILYLFGVFSINILICILLAQNLLVNVFEPPIVVINQYIVNGELIPEEEIAAEKELTQ